MDAKKGINLKSIFIRITIKSNIVGEDLMPFELKKEYLSSILFDKYSSSLYGRYSLMLMKLKKFSPDFIVNISDNGMATFGIFPPMLLGL